MLRDDSTWIQTYTGIQFWPLDPNPDDVEIEDIAHALSMKCRFTGHCNEFYSVAQHSCLVALNCTGTNPGHMRDIEALAFQGLLHDAAEAYSADVASPIKKRIKDFNIIEERLMVVICERFGICYPLSPDVKVADRVLLNTERRDLMKTPPRPWNTYGVGLLPNRIIPWSAKKAERKFLEMFRRLYNDA